jgi:hypothetical protein
MRYHILKFGNWNQLTIKNSGRIQTFDRVMVSKLKTPICRKSTNYYDHYEKSIDTLKSVMELTLIGYGSIVIAGIGLLAWEIWGI